MKISKAIIIFAILTYLALFSTIWLHEIGHALVYFFYDCKENLSVTVPLYFANASPNPLIHERVGNLNANQIFQVSIAGIVVNIIFGLFSMLIVLIYKFHWNRFVLFFISIFGLTHFLEASSYLTICNIIPLSDMIGIINYNKKIQLPLLFIGILIVLLMMYYIMKTRKEWRKFFVIYSIITFFIMGGLRLFFTLL